MRGNLPMEFLTQWKQITSKMLIIHNPGGNENKVMAEHVFCPECWPPTRNGPQGSSGLSQKRPGWLVFDSNIKPHGKRIACKRMLAEDSSSDRCCFEPGISALWFCYKWTHTDKESVHARTWQQILFERWRGRHAHARTHSDRSTLHHAIRQHSVCRRIYAQLWFCMIFISFLERNSHKNQAHEAANNSWSSCDTHWDGLKFHIPAV